MMNRSALTSRLSMPNESSAGKQGAMGSRLTQTSRITSGFPRGSRAVIVCGQPERLACMFLDGCLTPQAAGWLGGAPAECGLRIARLQPDPGRLGLRHPEPLEDVQRLPEQDPRRVRLMRAERRLGDPLEHLGLFVRITDLPGQRQRRVVGLGRLAVPARATPDVGYPADRCHLVRQVPDVLGDQPGPLIVNERLVITFR